MNRYNPNIHHRRSIRLKGYDYSQAGLYFVTICVKNREYLFGNITNGIMILNDAGKMVDSEWLKLPKRFKNIKLHEYRIMPNHFHAILEIVPVGTTLVVAPNEKGNHEGYLNGKKTLGDMVGAFESITTVEYVRVVKQNNWQPFDGKLWQRNYWEHIIRDENEYHRISKYIMDNPMKWKNDKFNLYNKEGEE